MVIYFIFILIGLEQLMYICEQFFDLLLSSVNCLNLVYMSLNQVVIKFIFKLVNNNE